MTTIYNINKLKFVGTHYRKINGEMISKEKELNVGTYKGDISLFCKEELDNIYHTGYPSLCSNYRIDSIENIVKSVVKRNSIDICGFSKIVVYDDGIKILEYKNPDMKQEIQVNAKVFLKYKITGQILGFVRIDMYKYMLIAMDSFNRFNERIYNENEVLGISYLNANNLSIIQDNVSVNVTVG